MIKIMNLDQSLLRAIIESPDDDLPRLLAADWLEERGDAERATAIRRQCQWPWQEQWGARSFDGVEIAQYVVNADQGFRWPLDIPILIPHFLYVMRRGFIESITCTAADWLRHADAITAAHPVRAVTLTSRLNWPDFTGDLGERLLQRWPRIAFTLPPEPFLPNEIARQIREEIIRNMDIPARFITGPT